MTSTGDEYIDLACMGLKEAVKKYCKKRKRDESSSTKPINHACNILRQLTLKRNSLEQGLTALEQSWKGDWRININADNIAAVLTHVFHQYLRLRDGMNLMTSGECRHAGDVQQAKQQKKSFRSQLNRQSHRGDGYTKLYNSEYYSGYGWDEFFDPQVGVLHRLQQALGSNNAWDTLLDYGAQAFESCLDEHQSKCHDIQSRFDELRNTMVEDLRKHCASVTMFTQDKMERLEVTLKGEGTQVSLARRANDFQVHDVNGCLPNGWNVSDWKRSMECPRRPKNEKRAVQVLPPAKKRRIIQDSDDDDDEVEKKPAAAPVAVAAVDGLRVEVKTKAAAKVEEEEEEKEGETIVNVNLRNLKKGVYEDAPEALEALEKSREVLEAEEVGGEIPTREVQGAVDEASELKHDVMDARTKVERLKRVVTRVKERQDEFDDELWDARECLREASMTLGSNLLSLCAIDKENDDYGKNLEEARDCFSEAQGLVKQQESVHQAICKQSNDSSEEARAIRRKLLLLRGRAHANLGIALVELSLMKCPEPVRKGLEKEANAELENAKGCADSIRARCVTDETKGAIPSEIAMDRIEADRLDSLVNRWHAKRLWYQRRHREAALASEEGSNFFTGRKNNVSDEDMLEAQVELGIECFFASTSLADLALDALEKLQIVVQGHPKRQESLDRGQELFTMALEAYKRASSISTILQKLVVHHKSRSSLTKDALRENGILTAQEIDTNIKQMNSWWEKKKEGVVLHQKNGTNQNESDRLRNDLFSSGPSMRNQSNYPVKRFTVNESSSHRASRRRNQGGNCSSGTSSSGLGGRSNSASKSSTRYRKWGDALLPQVSTDSGETIPLLAYPCCAPELPPGFTPYRPNQ